MTYLVKEIDSLENISIDAWEKLSRNKSIFLEKIWFEYNCKELNLLNRVIGIFYKNELVGMLPIFIVKNSNIDVWHNVYNFFKFSDDFNYNKNCFENKKEEEVLPYVIITSPYGYICDIISGVNFNYDLISRIQDQIDVICCEENAVICAYLWVKESLDCFDKVLLEKRFNKIFMGGDHYIYIDDFKSFDDYLNVIKKKRSRDIRREMRIFDENQYIFTVSNDIKNAFEEIVTLRSNFVNKYGDNSSLDKVKREIEFYQKYKEKVLVAKVYCKNELIGYMIGFSKQDVFYCKSIGFDYDKSKYGYCYFNIFYRLINYLILNTQVTKIEMGGGSVEAKLRKGFKIDNYFGYFKTYDENMNWYINDIRDYSNKKRKYYDNLIKLHSKF